ncbi:MAG TPA: hypothetical protein VMZ28_03820 [Kofleriaceae bacterium]|nr:hypothetical protein [Kofleriaceae bacterium]
MAMALAPFVAVAPADAGGKPRLGNFQGTEKSQVDTHGVDVRVSTPIKTRMRLRRDRGPRGKGRLYVYNQSDKPGTWIQAFDVVDDQVKEEGGRPVRVISLRRPGPKTASGRANERRLAEWLSASTGKPDSITELEGGGEVRIDGDTMAWTNRGSGMMNAGRSHPVTWDETTTSVRVKRGAGPRAAARTSRDPADIMNEEFGGALRAFQQRGGMVFEKPATQAWHGVHPTTGEYLIASGNQVEGISIRTTSSDGSYTERTVAPDGSITDAALRRADAALAKRARVAKGAWVVHKVSATEDTVVIAPAPSAPTSVVVIDG